MAVTEELRILIKAEADKAIREVRKMDKQLDNTAKASLDFGKIASGAMGIGAVVMAARTAARAIGDMMDAYATQEMAEAKIEQAIRSTAGAAGLSAKELKSMAAALQQVTTYGDETILGAQAMLLTFTKIGRETFPEATEAILNMAAAMGQDLKSVTIQVGKALNDPLLGITALGRAGVQFTEDQKDVIESMVEMNDLAGAQALILSELETQFGGMARAMADTSTGAMTQFENALGDVKEMFGGVFSEGIKPILQGLTDMLTKITQSRDLLIDYNTMMLGTAFYGSLEEANAALAVLHLQHQDTFDLMRRLEEETSTRGVERYKEAVRRWEIEGKEIRRIQMIAGAFYAESRKQTDAQKKAAEDRRREEEKALRIAEAYAKTSEGKIEAIEAMIAEWEAMTAASTAQAEQINAVLNGLYDQLEAARDQLGVYVESNEQLKDHAESMDSIEESSRVTADYFEDIASSAEDAKDHVLEMIAPLSGLAGATAEYFADIAPATADVKDNILEMTGPMVEMGMAGSALARGWEDIEPAIRAANDELDLILPKLKDEVSEYDAMVSRHERIQEQLDDEYWSNVRSGEAMEKVNALLADRAREAAAAAREIKNAFGTVAKIMTAISDDTADWNSMLEDTAEILLNQVLPGLGSIFTAAGNILERFTLWANRLFDPGYMTLDEMVKLNEELIEAQENAEEMDHAFSDTGEGFGEMVDGMMHDLDDVLRAIGETYDEELYLLQHLLDEGMIGVEEYLRRLGELKDWKAGEEAGAGGGGGSSTNIASSTTAPLIPSASFAPAGGPSYSLTVIAPTGNAEEIARVADEGFKTLDRRRRL